jgi:hypothetical protein
MTSRSLTPGEIGLLQPIFGQTLPYDSQTVDTNDGEWGGAGNSITPNGIPYFSPGIFVSDFSALVIPLLSRWIFIHEFMHVWQLYHGTNPIAGAIYAWLSSGCDYDAAYPYDLTTSSSLGSFNIEQQASIVADYWYVSISQSPRYNNGSDSSLTTYQNFIAQVQGAGPPNPPPPPDDSSGPPPSDAGAPGGTN